MTYLITLDVGTSSTRAFIYDTGGNVHFTSTYTYTSIYTPPSQVEQDPADWRKAAIFTLKEAARYAQSKGLAITAIAVTSQRASVIPVDARVTPCIMPSCGRINVLPNCVRSLRKKSVPPKSTKEPVCGPIPIFPCRKCSGSK